MVVYRHEDTMACYQRTVITVIYLKWFELAREVFGGVGNSQPKRNCRPHRPADLSLEDRPLLLGRGVALNGFSFH